MRIALLLALAVITGPCGRGGDEPAAVADAEACLVGAGFRTMHMKSGSEFSGAPEVQMSAGTREVTAFLDYYGDEDQADAYREGAASSDRVEVEQRGRLLIFWIRGDETAAADRLRDCTA